MQFIIYSCNKLLCDEDIWTILGHFESKNKYQIGDIYTSNILSKQTFQLLEFIVNEKHIQSYIKSALLHSS